MQVTDEHNQINYQTMSKKQRSVGVDDLVLLDKISEDAIVSNLKARYAQDIIYVVPTLYAFSHSRPTSVLSSSL